MADSLVLPYTAVKNARGESTLRPMLSFVLANQEKSIEVSGLLDTGADVNVLPFSLGIDLGGIWEEQKVAVELSGNLNKYEARGIIFTATIGQFGSVRLAFAWTRAEEVPVLLGQVNFFSEFDVCFYGSRNTLEVRPRDVRAKHTPRARHQG